MAKDKLTTLSTDAVVKAVSEASKKSDAPVSQKDVAKVLSILKDVVGDALKDGQKVQLTGFVAFQPSYRAARKGNNVMTGKSMDIPESIVISVKAGKALKDSVKDMPKATRSKIKAASGK